MSMIDGDEAQERAGAGEGDLPRGFSPYTSEPDPAAAGLDPPTVELGSPQAPAREPAEEHAEEQRGYQANMSAEPETPGAGAEPLASEEPQPIQPEPQTIREEPQPIQEEPRPIQEEPQPQPAQESVASNGWGPTEQVGPPGSYGDETWWQRPEAAVGVAFVGGLILAALLKRRRS